MTPGTRDATREATRERILDGALRCIERWGLAKTSVEDVATAAEVSRATVYRYFPGGRDELVTETVSREVATFFRCLEQAVVEDRDIEARLVHALLVGRRALQEHRLLQQILSTEREAFLTELASIGPLLQAEVTREMLTGLDGERLRPGVDRHEAADYLTRLFLSYLGSPGGAGLDDPDAVRRLVRSVFLGGIVAR